MSKLNTMFGGFGLAAAMVAAVAVTGCDPYVGANESAPEILGVLVADANGNGVQPAQCSIETTLGCSADFDCATLCQLSDGSGSHTACISDADCTVVSETCQGQTCAYPSEPAVGTVATCGLTPLGQLTPDTGCIYSLPRRAGAVWGPGYPAVGPGGAWTVADVPVGVANEGWPGPAGAYVFNFATIRVIFNKLMDGESIQTSPVDLSPPAGSDLRITETVAAVTTTICEPNGTPAVPCQFDVWYDPSSPTPNYGAAMVLAPGALYNGGVGLLPDASYHITVATVMDQQSRTIPIDVTVITIP